jgi:hypothetical protein
MRVALMRMKWGGKLLDNKNVEKTPLLLIFERKEIMILM